MTNNIIPFPAPSRDDRRATLRMVAAMAPLVRVPGGDFIGAARGVPGVDQWTFSRCFHLALTMALAETDTGPWMADLALGSHDTFERREAFARLWMRFHEAAADASRGRMKVTMLETQLGEYCWLMARHADIVAIRDQIHDTLAETRATIGQPPIEIFLTNQHAEDAE